MPPSIASRDSTDRKSELVRTCCDANPGRYEQSRCSTDRGLGAGDLEAEPRSEVLDLGADRGGDGLG